MTSKQLPMAFIKKVHAVMKSLYYVNVERTSCNYDTQYLSCVTTDRAGLVLDILNGADDPIAMETISASLYRARILHEVKGTQILIGFEINRGLKIK